MADNFVTNLSELSSGTQRVIASNAASQGLTAEAYLASRGGVNPVTGKFGDSYDPTRDLTDAEYRTAIAGKTGAALGASNNAATAAKIQSAGGSAGGGGGGNRNVSAPKSEAQIAAEAAAAGRQAERQSAYDLLYSQFAQYGLGSLVDPLKGLIISGASPAEFTVKLRDSEPYQKRFAANKQRIANGFKAIDEATYLALEDKYQSIMQNYGLPASYYAKGDMGIQPGFEKFIAGNVDPVTLEERIMQGVKINKGSQTLIDTAKQFYPNLTDGDFLAYTLDPKNALSDIKRKVTAIEIGGAATQSGLQTNVARAEELGRYGVDKATAEKGYSTIGAGLQRGSQLAAIYQEDPYTQTTAEQEIFNVPGAQEARKARQKITGLEKAAFGGQTGITSGALARDRAGAY
jgi:hypothetical protein